MSKHIAPKAKISIVQILYMSCLWLAGLAAPMHAAADNVQPSAPKGRVANLSLHSAILGRDVPLHVWLPPGYDDAAYAAVKYPVMYMLDGAKMFDAVAGEKSMIHLDTSLDRLTAEREIQPVIVMAIDQRSTEAEREKEYLPYRALLAPNVATHGDLLPEFLVAEVLPKITARFRVTDDFRATGIAGFSASGAAALYILIRRPATFGLAILESPSMQIGNGQLLRDTMNLVKAGCRVAIGIGTREWGQDDEKITGGFRTGAVHWSEMLAANLRSAILPPTVLLTVDEGAEHNGKAWTGRFPKDFVFLFGKQVGAK